MSEPRSTEARANAPLPADPDELDRLIDETKRAMELARDHGFRPYSALCDEERFVVVRSRPGECHEVIAFRDLEAQATRANETNLILVGPQDSDAGTAVWTGSALRVVADLLGLNYEELRTR